MNEAMHNALNLFQESARNALYEGREILFENELYAVLEAADIAVPRAALPELGAGEYYWNQLEGLLVWARLVSGGTELLGRVDHLMETGANDVLVVRACEGSRDQRERLIPWIPGDVILDVDLAGRELLVDWDPEF
jgi:16S rRNA processing protein RimM